jgi:hypothetical protein
LALALAGCDKKPPEPPPSRPSLERPVLALNVTILSGTKLDARSAPAGGAPGTEHLKPGTTLRIKIPRAALVERGGIPGVFVLNEAGEARFRLVRPGRVLDAQAEILSGLHGNETLVLGDLAAVHDGTPIAAE